MIALHDVVEARGENITKLAKESGITRQTLYNALSKGGNPTFATINQVLEALGLGFAITDKEAA